MRTLRLLSFTTLIAVSIIASPRVSRGQSPGETKMLTQPAISASRIAFIYAGDLFVSEFNLYGRVHRFVRPVAQASR